MVSVCVMVKTADEPSRRDDAADVDAGLGAVDVDRAAGRDERSGCAWRTRTHAAMRRRVSSSVAVRSHSIPTCPNSATAALRSRSTVRPVECTTGLVRCMPISSGGTTSAVYRWFVQALERVEGVAGPDPVGAGQDAEVDPGAPRGAALDLQPGVRGLELVEQAVEGQGVLADPRGRPPDRCRRRAGRGCGPTSGRRSGTRPAGRAGARRRRRRRRGARGRAPAAGVRTAAAPSAPRRIQSGCCRARSLSGLTISGSTHSPNSMPRARTWSTRGCSPSGQTVASTYQSPRPAVSSRRPTNQPSSSTNRSTPTDAAASASAVSRSREWSK